MEENREQPIIMPATALNRADEQSAMSEIGSQNEELGKFKSVQALMDAYNNLQSEFTKKCQKLSLLQKDKTDEENKENLSEIKQDATNEPLNQDLNAESEASFNKNLNSFLENNKQASMFVDEIKEKLSSQTQDFSPFEVAWAKVVLSHLNQGDKINDPIINQYVLSDENVKNKIITDFIASLNSMKPPLIISSQKGERLSGVIPDNPKSLSDAKKIVDRMFG